MNLAEYSKKWNRDADNNFAVACYNDCSVDQLVNAIEPDQGDMNTWDISPDEWRAAVDAALTEKLSEDIDYDDWPI